jgi:hypothetical protein
LNVDFFGGAKFDPPSPLGTTERTRYVKVKTLEEAQAPVMRRWIQRAGAFAAMSVGSRGRVDLDLLGVRKKWPSRFGAAPAAVRIVSKRDD